MSAFTAQVWPINKAPKRLTLLGDKVKKAESATHVIEFPGGAIEVSRCSDGSYWAHILVNHGFDEGDGNGFTSARGDVIDGRIQRDGEHVIDVADAGRITQIAVRIAVANGGAK